MGMMPPPSAIPATLPVLSLGVSFPQPSSILAPASAVTAAITSTATSGSSGTAVPNPSTVASSLAAPLASPSLLPLPAVAAASSVLQGALTLGESLTPLPAKLVQKILELRYIEMSELLPEAWLLQQDSSASQNPLIAQFRRQKGPVSDILQWVQCYATLASVLASAYPQKISELLAYLSTIVKCSREFEGPAWVLYDRAFRRQAEATRDLSWSKINPSLFNLCFTGRARRRLLCHTCLGEGHTADTCAEATWQWPVGVVPPPTRPPLALTPLQPAGQRRNPRQFSLDQSHRSSQVEICRLFNHKQGSRCSFKPCRYVHICSTCRESGHGAGSCPQAGLPEKKRAREQ